jgi:hypothetical protein
MFRLMRTGQPADKIFQMERRVPHIAHGMQSGQSATVRINERRECTSPTITVIRKDRNREWLKLPGKPGEIVKNGIFTIVDGG